MEIDNTRVLPNTIISTAKKLARIKCSTVTYCRLRRWFWRSPSELCCMTINFCNTSVCGVVTQLFITRLVASQLAILNCQQCHVHLCHVVIRSKLGLECSLIPSPIPSFSVAPLTSLIEVLYIKITLMV